MKAIVQYRYGSTDTVSLADIDQPSPGPADVLVEVRAAAVDPGVWHLMTGLPYLVRLGWGLRAPKSPVLGMDMAGVVSSVGSQVTGFQPGDAVFGTCSGSFAEYATVPAARLALKPPSLTFEQAAALPISGCTALQAVRGVHAGQHVLVLGAGGGVGAYAVQLAHAFGATVTGVCSSSKVDLVRSLGADHVVDYTRSDFTGRYDLIVDIAGLRPLSRLRRALMPRGTLIIVGGEGGGRWFGGIDRMLRAMLWSPFLSQRLRGFFSRENAADFAELASLADSGKLTPVIDRTYPLGEVPEAIRYVAQGHTRGKVVITV